MTDHEPLGRRQRDVARLIRRSAVLDPVLKRQWLRVLPHLKPADLARLEAILAAEAPHEEGRSTAPAGSSPVPAGEGA